MINRLNTRVTLVSGGGVIGVQCEQEGAGLAALGDSGVEHQRVSNQLHVCDCVER